MQRKGIWERLSLAADLSEEPTPGLPLVEIAGEHRVLIENHQGVVEYGLNTVRVKVKFGQLCICGNGLKLTKMGRGQLTICGNIDSVQLIRRCK